MKKEITITNANNQEKFICFNIDGLENGIMVGLYPNNDGLSIAYKGDVVGVPFNADSVLINELNDRSFPKSDEIECWQPDQVTELDDETFDAFEKEVMNLEPDMKRVEAAKKIFEGIDEIPVDMSSCVELYGKPHLLELMDEWGIDGTNYADFRSVIQEHCFNKGLYAFDDIEKTWKSHVQSLKDAAKSIKNGNY